MAMNTGHMATLALAPLLLLLLLLLPRGFCNPQAASIFRSYDGTFNNLQDVNRGAAGTPMARGSPYFNWTAIISELANPRLVSKTNFDSYFSLNTDSAHNLLFQAILELFLIDIADIEKETTFSYISVLECDAVFDPLCLGNQTIRYLKNRVDGYTNEGVPIYKNKASHYVDASFLYGLSEEAVRKLRTFRNGMMYLSANGYPRIIDFNISSLDESILTNGKNSKVFEFADKRLNQNICTQVFSILLLREHNRIATQFTQENPDWSDETVFQYARRWVIDIWQNILLYRWGLFYIGGHIPSNATYIPAVDASIDIEVILAMSALDFTTAASHLVPMSPDGSYFSIGAIPMEDTSYNIDLLLEFGLEAILMGMFTSPGGLADNNIAKHFLGYNNAAPVDQLAVALQRSRDMGISSFNELRASYDLPKVKNLIQVSENQRIQMALTQLYSFNVSKLEALVGFLSEDIEYLQITADIYHHLLYKQLERLVSGDRFFFSNNFLNRTNDEIKHEQNFKISNLISRNTNLKSVPPQTFGVNNINFIKLNNLWSYNDSGTGYQNFSCKFSVSWISTNTSLIIDYCLSYDSGYFGIGVGHPDEILDFWIVILGDTLDVKDYYFKNSIPYPDEDIGGTNDLKWSLQTSSLQCKKLVRVERLFDTGDPYDIPISTDAGSNLTTFFWAYSTPSFFVNVFTPTEEGYSKGLWIPLALSSDEFKPFEIQWSIYLVFYHAILIFLAAFLFFPFSCYIETFWAKLPGGYSLRNAVEIIGSIVFVYSILIASVGSKGAFNYAHSYFGIFALLFHLISAVYGYLKRDYWPMKGKTVHSSSFVYTALLIIAFTLSSVALFLGLEFTIDISASLIFLHPLAAAWITLLVIIFGISFKMDNKQQSQSSSPVTKMRDSLLNFFKVEKFVPDYTYSQLLDHVSKGSCLVLYKSKIYDIRSLYNKHPGGALGLAATVGTDITKFFEGAYGNEVSRRTSQKPKIFSFVEKLIKSGGRYKKNTANSDDETNSEQLYIERCVQRVRQNVFADLKICHSSVAIKQLESVYVGILKKSDLEILERPERSALSYPMREWYPNNFPKNENLRSPAFCTIIRTVVIYCDRKTELEYNSLTEQSAHRFRFAFENARDELWFLPGDQVEISIPDDYGRPLSMTFTPVTCHVEGYLDLHLKLYKNARASALLDILEPCNLVTIRGPIPSKTPVLSSRFSTSGCAQQLLLLCAGTGVTLGMQTIDYYLSFCPRNEDGRVLSKIAMLYFSRDENETMLNEELERLKRVSGGAVEIFYCFTKSKTWNGPKGRVSVSLLEETVFKHLNVTEAQEMYFTGDFSELAKKHDANENSKDARKKGPTDGGAYSLNCSSDGLIKKSSDQILSNDALGQNNEISPDIKQGTVLAVVCGPQKFTKDASEALEMTKISNLEIVVMKDNLNEKHK